VTKINNTEVSRPNTGTVNVEVKSASKFPWGCFIAVLAVLIGLFGFMLLSLWLLSSVDGSDLYSDASIEEIQVSSGKSTGKVAIIPVKGYIASQSEESNLFSSTTISPLNTEPMLKKALNDKDVKAVVLDMDTPGGEVLASDLIYRKVKELDAKKPVVVWMGNQAASGGYYIASGASEIVAHPSTITGSIGVIAQFMDMSGLYEKLGVKTKTFKSAEFKDNAALWEENNTELNEIYQVLIDETYDRFVDIVAEGRDMDKADVLALADGRVYSGLQAEKKGLVDSLGIRDDAVARAADLANVSDPDVVEYSGGTSLFGDFGLTHGSLASILGFESSLPTANSATPGLYMFYLAEPLGTNL
jgi:protease IV